MRFKEYINEALTPQKWEELKTVLERDCMPYIKETKGCQSLLRRGSKDMFLFYGKKTQRQDRKPRMVDQDIHQMMDDWTKKNWGFRARSTSTFATNREHNARMYGSPFFMFPIGNFKYAWNDNVTELYKVYDGWNFYWHETFNHTNDNSTSVYDEIDEEQAKEITFNERVVPILQDYKTRDLNKLLRQRGDKQGFAECIVNCKSYYLVNPEWMETLYAWYGDKYWREK